MKKLLILGAGGYSQTVADMALQLNCCHSIAFLDDGKQGGEILGRCEEYRRFLDENTEIYPAFGNNALRMQWIRRLQEEGISVPTLVHPRAYVSPKASLGVGTMVLPMAVVNVNTQVGDGCILNLGCIIDHDCILEAGVHLCPGVILKAGNRISSCTKLEAGTVVLANQYPL